MNGAELVTRGSEMSLALQSWSRVHLRDLPWRNTRDPWLILLSEVMSHQTQLARVVPKWVEAVARWPRVDDFASADTQAVLEWWMGLGYPRRALAVHATACRIVADHAGEVPAERDALLAFPGVGPYTAAAVRVFAFELDDVLVDANVRRVHDRLVGRSLSPVALHAAAGSWVPPGQSWEHHQAILDLGALICGRTPACERCPLQAHCWYAEHAGAPDPAKMRAKSRQAPYLGSRRWARGEVMRAAKSGADLEGIRERLESAGFTGVVEELIGEQMVRIEDGVLRLGSAT